MLNFKKNLKKVLINVKKYNIIGHSKRQKGRRCKMELTKNIFFNTDKLIENSKVKISYTGKFYQENCEKVTIHYGFGDQWDNVNDIEMEKTELGFQTEINLLEGENFGLCFKNEKNEWDNNDGKNYVFEIEKAQDLALVPQDIVSSIDAPRRLRKSYIWSKKIRIAVYKIIHYLPKIISGNFKKKTSED